MEGPVQLEGNERWWVRQRRRGQPVAAVQLEGREGRWGGQSVGGVGQLELGGQHGHQGQQGEGESVGEGEA